MRVTQRLKLEWGGGRTGETDRGLIEQSNKKNEHVKEKKTNVKILHKR